jgi:nitrogen regulatory protein PII-like uncharacterized protein
LTDTTVPDSPVLSHSQLLCKIPFGVKIGSEMNVISIANRTTLFVHSIKYSPPKNWAPFKQRELRQQEQHKASDKGQKDRKTAV